MRRRFQHFKVQSGFFLSLFHLFLLSRQPFNFITPEVVEATCQCLLAQGEEAEKNRVNREVDTEALILEEFGRCLTQIIDMANKNKAAALVPS